MINKNTEVFGGARCAWVANFIENNDNRTWIFSICSDERIPPKLEKRLHQAHAADRPSHLIIIGDFPSISPECSPASFEAMRLIAELSNFQGTIKVCWIDGETINLEETSPPPMTWHEFYCSELYRKAYAWPKVQPTIALEHAVCTEIIHLLGNQPGMRLSNNGSVVALDLSNGEPYRRSLAAGLSQDTESQLWSLVKRLPSLQEFRAVFSNFKYIPDLSELKKLETLDLRGNPGIKLSHLSSVTSLKKLNAAACALEAIPSEIEDLPSLKTLLLHKNTIHNISGVNFPPLLERISLYRNQIKYGNLNLSKCKMINEINLGANPIKSMTATISDDVSSLSLRLRYVKNQVKIFWRGGVGTGPVIIYDN